METITIKPKDAVDVERLLKSPNKLVLHNDNHNSIDHIIFSLIEVCNHGPEQAEQAATIAHYKGACDVKLGTEEQLKDMAVEMMLRSITVTIETN